MKIILTSDVELWSWNGNFEKDIEKGVLKLVELVEKEKIPITLFISLSDKGYGDKNYKFKIKELIKKIKSKYIEFGAHTHCKNLSLKFPTDSDNLKDYSKIEIVEILRWYKKEIEKITNKKIITHRAGSYAIPNLNLLNECFNDLGLKIDSSDISIEYSKMLKLRNLIEIPPATNKFYSKSLRVFSPEQMSLKEMIKFYEESKEHTDILVINFHSFSVYGNLGWKKRVWYAMPKIVRIILKPLINNFKPKIRAENIRLSQNFVNLYRIIKFLKKDNCEFIKLNKVK